MTVFLQWVGEWVGEYYGPNIEATFCQGKDLGKEVV